MKTIITILLILILPVQLFSEKKSKEDPKDVKIDSLTKANARLTLQADSLSAELRKYMVVYTTIKEKVIHYNYDPEKTSFLIDSMKSSRDSISNKVMLGNLAPSRADSLMRIENTKLKYTVDSLKTAGEKYRMENTAQDVEKAKAISNLKQLKELADAKVISEAEFISIKKKYLEKL